MSQDRIRELEQIIEQQKQRAEKAEAEVQLLEKIIKHQNSRGAIGVAVAETADGKVYTGAAMPNTVEPMLAFDVKLASILVHIQELLSPDGQEADKQAILGLLQDQEIIDYLNSFDPALLPLKRK